MRRLEDYVVRLERRETRFLVACFALTFVVGFLVGWLS